MTENDDKLDRDKFDRAMFKASVIMEQLEGETVDVGFMALATSIKLLEKQLNDNQRQQARRRMLAALGEDW